MKPQSSSSDIDLSTVKTKETSLEDVLLSPRVGEAVTAEQSTGDAVFKQGTFQECLSWLTVIGPSSKFLLEATHFLFGYRSFATSSELLALVAEMAEKSPAAPRLWEFVHIWVKILSDKDTALLQKILNLKNIPQNVSNDIKLMLLRFSKKGSSTIAAAEGAAKEGFGNLLSGDWSPQQIAECLTMTEAQIFYQVAEHEFLDNAFADDRRAERAPHLSKLAARFNSISFWTASQVLLRGGDSSKQRALEIDRFISVMEHLKAINNFDGMMSLLSGLNNSSISRLRDDWSNVSSEKLASFHAMEKLLDPNRNFRAYRDEIAKLSTKSKPVLPYISVHLRDILFIELGNPRSGDVINYEKVLLFGSALSKLCYFQRYQYSFVVDPEIARYFEAPNFLTEEQLHARSVEYRAVGDVASPPKTKVSGGDKSPRSVRGLLSLSPRGAERSYDELDKTVNPLFAVSAEDLKSAQNSSEPLISHNNSKASESKLPDANVPVVAAIPIVAEAPISHAKQAMTRDGQFLVIPKNEQESLACAKSTNEPGLNWLIQECEKRNIIMPQSHYLRFFVVDHMQEKKALKHVIDYWTYYKSIGFRNIVTVDVSPALSSLFIVPPFGPDVCDLEGRPYILMRANLWFDGDPSHPSVGDLCQLLMWIGEQLAKSVQCHYTGFTFVMDMKDWTKRNFSTPVYTQLMHMIQDCLPVRCEQFIFLDVPKVFSASWKLVSTSLKPSFKKIMAISNRQDCAERFIDKASLPPDLGGSYVAPNINVYVQQMKKKEKQIFTPPPADKQPELTPIPDDALSNDGASVPGVYALKIRSRTNSRTNSVSNLAALTKEKEKDKTLISKNSSKLSFFGRKKE